MNHPDAEDLTRTLRGPRTLLELCLDLRMAHNGSADPISEEDTAAALAYLNYRLATWKPSALPSGARFDECVRALVLATIIEVQCRQTERARILGLPEIQSPITDAAIDAARWGLLGRRVRITRNPEHDRLFDPLHRAALDGTVAKVDAQDATGAYHVTSDDETQWGWFRPDELAAHSPTAKADPLAGLPEAERARIIAGAANAMPENRARFVANSAAAYHARQSGVGVAIGREGQWFPQSTGTHTFGGRLRADCAHPAEAKGEAPASASGPAIGDGSLVHLTITVPESWKDPLP